MRTKRGRRAAREVGYGGRYADRGGNKILLLGAAWDAGYHSTARGALVLVAGAALAKAAQRHGWAVWVAGGHCRPSWHWVRMLAHRKSFQTAARRPFGPEL